MWAVTLVGVGVLVVAPAAAVAAEPNPAEVEELIRQGNALRRDGKDFAAVPVFQKAYDLERSARTAAQLGLVEAKLGYYMAAERHIQEALAFPRHPWVSKNKELIEKTLNGVQSYIGELEVTGTPHGAELLVNGRSVGTLPLPAPLRLGEGEAQLALRSKGYEAATRSVRIAGGKKENVAFALERAKTPVATTSGGPGGEPGAMGGPTDPAGLGVNRSGARAGGTPAWVRPAAWTAAAASLASLSVGTYAVLRQRSKRDEFAEYIGSDGGRCSTSVANQGGGRCHTIYEEANSAARLAIIGFVAGGVLATGAIVGFVLSNGAGGGGGGDDLGLRDWQLALAPGEAQVGYVLRF